MCRLDSENSAAGLSVRVFRERVKVRQVLGTHGRSIEPEVPAALEDAVDDGLGEIIVVKDGPPTLRTLLVVKIMARLRMCRSPTT